MWWLVWKFYFLRVCQPKRTLKKYLTTLTTADLVQPRWGAESASQRQDSSVVVSLGGGYKYDLSWSAGNQRIVPWNCRSPYYPTAHTQPTHSPAMNRGTVPRNCLSESLLPHSRQPNQTVKVPITPQPNHESGNRSTELSIRVPYNFPKTCNLNVAKPQTQNCKIETSCVSYQIFCTSPSLP